MYQKLIPGTNTPYGDLKGGAFALFQPMIKVAEGLTLAQVCSITGLEGSTIQNWVKRGFISHPVKKRYFERQLSRILILSALRDSMQLDSIVALLKYINSYVEDDSDDNISEPELFDYFCNIVRKIDIEKGISFKEIDLYINEEIKDFKGPFSDSKQRVYNTLKTMILGYITGRYKQETDFFYNSVLN